MSHGGHPSKDLFDREMTVQDPLPASGKGPLADKIKRERLPGGRRSSRLSQGLSICSGQAPQDRRRVRLMGGHPCLAQQSGNFSGLPPVFHWIGRIIHVLARVLSRAAITPFDH
jgi:hypothetical protein